MLVVALVLVAALFALALLGRLGGARRAALAQNWLALLLAGAALFALFRGALPVAAGLAAAAAALWLVDRGRRQREASGGGEDSADLEARTLLGLGANATEAEIRAAYRAKMAAAHPDRGGGHANAARLTAARDRLLRKRR